MLRLDDIRAARIMARVSNQIALSWSLFVAALLHIVEEFAFPGGFSAWYRSYKPAIASSFTTRFAVWINVALLALCANVALAVGTRVGVAAWLAVSALLFSNAVFHLIGAWHTKRYSPGVITGTLLYVPLSIYGYVHFVTTGRASTGTAVVSFLIGASYHPLAYLNHLRRARRSAMDG